MQDKELNIDDLANGALLFFKKNWIFLLLFVILGIALGSYRYANAKPGYKTDVYAKSSFVPLDLIRSEVTSLNTLIEEGNMDKLGDLIEMKDGLNQLSSIKFFTVSNEDDIFSIQVESFGDSSVNHQVVNGLLIYFENNPFLAKYLDAQRQSLEENVFIYKQELNNLKNIQERLEKGEKLGNQMILADPGSLSQEIITFKQLLIKNEQLLEEVQAYMLIDQVDIKSNPSLLRNLLSAIVVVSFLGSLVLISIRLFLK